jgi:hypothetical protein
VESFCRICLPYRCRLFRLYEIASHIFQS